VAFRLREGCARREPIGQLVILFDDRRDVEDRAVAMERASERCDGENARAPSSRLPPAKRIPGAFPAAPPPLTPPPTPLPTARATAVAFAKKFLLDATSNSAALYATSIAMPFAAAAESVAGRSLRVVPYKAMSGWSS
jgi:hypothetical protein